MAGKTRANTQVKESLSTPKQNTTSAGKRVATDSNSLPAVTLVEMEQRLSKVTEEIVSRISAEMKSLRYDLTQRIALIEQNLAVHVKEIDKSLYDLHKRVEEMETHLAESQTLKREVADLQRRCESYEKREIAADAVLFGIPQLPGENVETIFHRLCHTIDCTPPTLKSAFRTQKQSKTYDSPIIFKFSSPQEKNSVLTSVALYRKRNNRQLCLQDVGINSAKNNNIYMHGSLTSRNRSFLQQAVRLKRRKQLFSVYTRFGSVFVKESVNGMTIQIENDETLNAIAAAGRNQEDAT